MSAHRHSYATPVEAAEACGRHVLSLLEQALAGESYATLAVSGGSSPRRMFEFMARAGFEWDRVHVFWVDERAVPPTDAQSNYRMADEAFITPARVPRKNVHRIHADLGPDQAAKLYSDEMREFFRLDPGELPHFDVIHRGIGSDAHTASLFPGEPLIEDREGLCAAVYVEKLAQWRITLLPGVLLAARHTALLVTGDDKAEPLRAVLQDEYDPLRYPAQVVIHHGRRVTCFLDEAAGRLLV